MGAFSLLGTCSHFRGPGRAPARAGCRRGHVGPAGAAASPRPRPGAHQQPEAFPRVLCGRRARPAGPASGNTHVRVRLGPVSSSGDGVGRTAAALWERASGCQERTSEKPLGAVDAGQGTARSPRFRVAAGNCGLAASPPLQLWPPSPAARLNVGLVITCTRQTGCSSAWNLQQARCARTTTRHQCRPAFGTRHARAGESRAPAPCPGPYVLSEVPRRAARPWWLLSEGLARALQQRRRRRQPLGTPGSSCSPVHLPR